MVQVIQQDCEFISAKARRRVPFAEYIPHPVGHTQKDLVSDIVPQAVVDHLEPVEIEE